MEKIKITNGVYWVEIPEENLRILCGCPADVVKHLMIRGLISPKTRNGVSFESGPNAILLSDVSIQNGQLSNLAEFPILQMLYRQGMILPGHPNNTGQKPLLIGHPSQIAAQSEYILRGNYGLTSVEEIEAAGYPHALAEEYFRVKLKFAFGQIKRTDQLLDFCPVENAKTEVRGEVRVRRISFNLYEFSYKGESVLVNLNLEKNEEYRPAILLDYHRIKREYFSIIHLGEGDGWDVTKPCMSSLLTFQGKFYLIDAGPNVLHSLMALGLSVNDIEGIFHTHAHDDHFAGLTSLVRSDHPIKYYASPLVRASVVKKLSALLSISEKRFFNTFVVRDLAFDQWNSIGGLEVMPVYSPHPVETSVLFFRAFWEGGYRTYAHLADIPSLKTALEIFPENDPQSVPEREEIKKSFVTQVAAPYDRKKIDIGGGMIHGQASDFRADASKKIILSHISRELTPEEKEIGSNVTFGQQDVLIPSNKDYALQNGFHTLREYFPAAPASDINMLLNCPETLFQVGEIILKKGEESRAIQLTLSGVTEVIDTAGGLTHRLSSGSFIGELSALKKEPSRRTYRAYSYVNTLSIPFDIYREFIRRNYNEADLLKTYETMAFIQCTGLFGEMVSSTIQHFLAARSVWKTYQPGENLNPGDEKILMLVKEGEAGVLAEGRPIETIGAGDFFGEENMLLGSQGLFKGIAKTKLATLNVPIDALKGIPILEWKLMETFERRLKAFGTGSQA